MRCALVGVGFWSKSALLPALRAQPHAEVVACVSGSLEEATVFAAKELIPSAYRSLAAMLDAEKLDFAAVATPDHVHAEAVAALLRAGVPVYCEKPLANDGPTAHELVALQRSTGVPATVGYSFRFNPSVQALKRDLDAGRFGEIWLIELAEHNPQFHPDGGKPMNWKGDPAQAAGGSLFEYGSHVIDMGAWLLGPIARVSTSLKRVLPGARLDDIATMQLQFENGTTGLLIASWVLSGGFPGTRIKLHGSRAIGEVLLDDRMPNGQSYRVSLANLPVGSDETVEPMREPRSDATRRHIAAFLATASGTSAMQSTLPTLSQAAHVQDVLAAALRAEDSWQSVVYRPSYPVTNNKEG